jgi:hypothetical protein
MGMFDYINCKYPLPIADTQGLQFQTKDTDSQYLDLYEIREDGTLWHEDVERKWVEDKSALLGGYMERVSAEWKPVQMTGEIRFYTSHGPMHKPGDGFGQWWIEYSAYFVDGKLQSMNLIEDRRTAPLNEPVPNVGAIVPNSGIENQEREAT